METYLRVSRMILMLEVVREQNSDLRVMMEDVLRRVSALEREPGEWATGPRKGEDRVGNSLVS